ncbi:MAG: hypothetical protein V5804_08935 [Mucilaginibacter sp.]|uniref:hypothetical protein n=1 Tax=Mucilaginibacter sp. TaxID=1882438 RepID=UPI0034E46845
MLEQKEPKIQDKPDPSGRFVGPFRVWAMICRFGMRAFAIPNFAVIPIRREESSSKQLDFCF